MDPKEMDTTDPEWLKLSRELAALAQNGLRFTDGPFDRERYERILEISVAFLAKGFSWEREKVGKFIYPDKGYITPKVDVRAVIEREGKLLFVRERSDTFWSLPGGFCDLNQSPKQCIEREVREEAGFECRAIRLLGLFDRQFNNGGIVHPFHVYKLFFHCEFLGGEPTTSHEITEVAFFGSDEIPELSSGRVTRDHVVRMFEHIRNPNLPADFE